LENLAPVSLTYDHLPSKLANILQNLWEWFYDFRFTTCGYNVFFVYENRSIYPGRTHLRSIWRCDRNVMRRPGKKILWCISYKNISLLQHVHNKCV